MLTSFFSLFSALLLAFSYPVNAAPATKPVEFLAYAPQILAPTAGTVWQAGQNGQVIWNTSAVPLEAQGYNLTILLGYLTFDSTSEHLNVAAPLASGVPIMDGNATVTVPANTTFGTNYIVVTIGDSGDRTKMFTILPSYPS